MSEIRVNSIQNESADGAVNLIYGAQVPTGMGITGAGGINITGVVTATSFSGAATGLSGNFSGNASGLTGTPDITVDGITANDINVSGSCTITGNLTVDGTQTIVNTSVLDIADKTVGIASTTAATDATADGAGIEIYASSTVADNNKTFLWERDTGCWTFGQPAKVKGLVETVATATTYIDGTDNGAGTLVLELDLAEATTFTHSTPAAIAQANIGIVSFKNMPADPGVQNGQTVTVLFTQGSAAQTGAGNTVATNGIGATCTVIPYADGAAVAGIQTSARVGGGTGAASTVTLSPDNGNKDFISFFVHYNGGSNTDLKSYDIYVTKNGGFVFGGVGI